MGKNHASRRIDRGVVKETRLALDAYASLVRATESMGVLLSRQLDSFGMTMPQFRVLEALLHGGTMSQSQLCEKTFFGESNMAHLLKRLEAHTLIFRPPHKSDKRQWDVHLTPEGQERIEEVFPSHARFVRARMRALNHREQEILARLCEKLGEGDPVRFLKELKKAVAEDAG